MAYSTGGLIIGAILLAPIALFVEGIPQWPETTALLGTIYSGLFPTALATILLVSVINSAGPAFMSMVNYQVPLWAIAFGVIFLNEEVPASFIAALVLIMIGLAISQSKSKQKINL